ncbi:MAG: T9SS type A sorting domain-containing protein [Bacteroidales bacterium]
MKKNLLILSIITLSLSFSGISVAQIYHFQETFVLNAPPVGWIATNVTYSLTHNNEDLNPGTYSAKLKPNESFLMIKALNTAATLQFYVKVRDTSTLSDFHLMIEKSYDQVAWTEIGKDPCNMENDSIFQLVNIQVNDAATQIYLRFHAASVNGTASLGLCYIDDISVTKMAIEPNDATLTDLTYNGISIDGFTAANLDYIMEVPYSVEHIEMAGTPNNPGATITITNPTNLRGYEADRTGTVAVTSQDGTVTKNYKIVFTVSDYIYKVGFVNTGDGVMPLPGWRGGYTYTTNTVVGGGGNHGEFFGLAALKFMRGQPDKIGFLNTAKYTKSDTLTFWLAIDQPDGVENLLVQKKVLGGIGITLGNITSSEMTAEWKKFTYFIGEDDSTQVIFTPTLTAEGLTRIWIDDLSLKGKKVSGLSVSEVNSDTRISVYPNPAHNTLTVQSTDRCFTSLTVSDLTGRRLMTEDIRQSIKTFDIHSLPGGVYFVTLKGENKTITSKFVKH